jgi:hypothetical protein
VPPPCIFLDEKKNGRQEEKPGMRQSPLESATQFPVGTIKLGVDKNRWKVVAFVTKNGVVQRWKRVTGSHKSKAIVVKVRLMAMILNSETKSVETKENALRIFALSSKVRAAVVRGIKARKFDLQDLLWNETYKLVKAEPVWSKQGLLFDLYFKVLHPIHSEIPLLQQVDDELNHSLGDYWGIQDHPIADTGYMFNASAVSIAFV